MSRAVKQGIFRDGNGAVVTTARAGTVSVFLAGTLTPADIYTASTGGVAVHSVRTDASGRFKFYINYLVYNIGQLFDIVLSGAGVNSQTYSDELINFLPYISYKDVYAEWWGAIPGAINDAAIKAAIADIPSGVGVTLHIPTSLIASTITVNKSDVIVTSDKQAITYDASFVGVIYGIQNVMFDITAERVSVVNSRFYQGAYTHANVFVYFDVGGSGGLVENNKFYNGLYEAGTLSTSIQTLSYASNIIVRDNYFKNCAAAIVFNGGYSMMSGNISENDDTNGAHDSVYSSNGGVGNSIVNNKVYRGAASPISGDTIDVFSCADVTVSGNEIYGIKAGVGINFFSAPAGVTGGIISNNIIDGGGLTAIAIWNYIKVDAGCSGIAIKDNILRNSPTSVANNDAGIVVAPNNNVVSGNVIAVGTHEAIRVDAMPVGTGGALEISDNYMSAPTRGITFGLSNNDMVPIVLKGNSYQSPIILAIDGTGTLPNIPIYMENEHFLSTSLSNITVILGKYIIPFQAGAFKHPYRITRNTDIFSASQPSQASYWTNTTWELGDTIHNSVPTVGQPIGWICTQTGTFGTFSEAGTTTSGSPIITAMADTSDIFVGDFVDASAGFAVLTILRVIAKTAATVTLDRNANASGAVTLSTTDPVWTAMANL